MGEEDKQCKCAERLEIHYLSTIPMISSFRCLEKIAMIFTPNWTGYISFTIKIYCINYFFVIAVICGYLAPPAFKSNTVLSDGYLPRVLLQVSASKREISLPLLSY